MDYIFGAVVLLVLLWILKQQFNKGNDQDIDGPKKRDHGMDAGDGGGA